MAVLISSFVRIAGDLNKKYLGPEFFRIRLDHLLHTLIYFLISMYYFYGIRKGIKLFEKNSLLKFVLVVFSLATITEIIQLWVPQRGFNPADWIANVIGIILGVMIIVLQGKNENRLTG